MGGCPFLAPEWASHWGPALFCFTGPLRFAVNRLHMAVTFSSHYSPLLEKVLELPWTLPKFAKRLQDRNVHICEIALGTMGHVSELSNDYSNGQASAVTGNVSNTVAWEEGTLKNHSPSVV